MKIKTLVGLTSLGAAGAVLSGYLLRRRPKKLRYAASGAAFLLPFGVYAVTEGAGESTTVLFISDTHDTPRSAAARVAQAMLGESGVDLVAHAGDVGDEGCSLYSAWWDVPYAPVRQRWTVIAASGNHDNTECFTQRFAALPRKVTLNNVDFFVLPWSNTISGTTLRWLDRQTLASTARWKVIVVHKGPWHVSAEEGRVYNPSASLLPILERIDLVLAGHNHVYWDSVHDVNGHSVRQINEVTSGKFYECTPDAVGCVSHKRGYSRITFGPDGIHAERRVME